VKLLRKVVAYVRVLRSAKRNKTDLTKYVARRPAIAAAIAGYETAIFFSNRMDTRAKTLATVRTSSLIGCPY
jgi:hypothetical protein